MTILVGCNQMNQFSPEQVIQNTLASENESIAYYGEIEMKIDGFEELDNSIIKEWRSNDKSRVEMEVNGDLNVTVSDGTSMIIYEEIENKALQINDMELDDFSFDPKEQIELLLDMLQDTHDIETIGEETVANRPTIHLKAEKRSDQPSLYGDQEFWIDKEHWMVLKMKMIDDGVESHMEYTKVDFNPNLEDSLFQLDLPEDVVIEEIDHLHENLHEEKIALKDIPNKLNEKVLYIPNSKERELDNITYTNMEGVPPYQEVSLDYKKDGLPLMTVTIMNLDDALEPEEIDLLEEGGEEVTIRNEKGSFLDVNGLRTLSWGEGNIRYSIHIIDPNVNIEEVQTWVNEMEEIK